MKVETLLITALKGLYNLAPNLISQTSKKIDKIAESRIKQAINSGGQKTHKIAAQIIRGAIVDVHKTPFRLLGSIGKQKSNQLKRKVFKFIKK